MIEVKQKMIEMAKNTFGLTEIARNAGYLMEDGTMLNFKEDSYSHGRDTDHREISNVISEFYGYIGDSESIDRFLLITNAIRISQIINHEENSLYIYINIDQDISEKQWRKLRRISEDNSNKYLIYDIISRRKGSWRDIKSGVEESGYPRRDIGKVRLAFNKVKGENI